MCTALVLFSSPMFSSHMRTHACMYAFTRVVDTLLLFTGFFNVPTSRCCLSTEPIYRISLSKLAQRQALRTMGGSSFIGIGGTIGLQDLKEDDSEDA